MARHLRHKLALVVSILPVILIGIDKPSSNETCCYSKQSKGEIAMAGTNAADYADRKSITANPAAKLTYDQPRISTTSGATGIATPYAGGNPTPITAPSYVAGGAPARYQAPATRYAAPAPAPAFVPPPPPPPPPAPPVGGRQWYGSLDEGTRAQTDAQYLGGDSDYNAQIGEYDRALNDFIARIVAQKANFDTDATNALGATDRNEQFSGNQLGEDFGARGMSYSGLFDKSKNELGERFKEQRGNIETVRSRNKSEADNRQADYQAENNIGRSNAKRSALTRMAAQQAMLDSNAGF